MDEPVSFWQSWFVWRDAIIVAALSAAALSYLGVWIVLKRVVYVPLALSQVSSAGVVLSFWLCGLLDLHETPVILDPTWMALLFALAAAFLFGRPGSESNNATAAAYLVASCAALLLAVFIRQDLHDVASVLFGSVVLVETAQIVNVGTAAVLVAVAHRVFYRRFLFASFDPDTAGASGIAVYRHEVLLYATMAIMISSATRAIGALPAFGFAVLPALAALRFAATMRAAFAAASLIGVLCAVVGYYLSFVLELPTGAVMVGLAAVVYLVAAIARMGRGGRRSGAQT
jgi:zinc transport system permease protein